MAVPVEIEDLPDGGPGALDDKVEVQTAAGASVFRALPDLLSPYVTEVPVDVDADGVTTADSAIYAALTASGPKVVRFKYRDSGVYRIAAKISATLTAATMIILDPGVTLKVDPSGSVNLDYAFHIACAGYDLAIVSPVPGAGICDGDDLCNLFWRVDNLAASDPSFLMDGVRIKNTLMRVGGGEPTNGNGGCLVYGRFERVEYRRCHVHDHDRLDGAGTPGSQGTYGLACSGTGSYWARSFLAHYNLIETITTQADAADAENADCDGILVFDDSAGATHGVMDALIEFNRFVDCKGRAIKAQADKAVARGNRITRSTVETLGGSCEIALQTGHGEISGNHVTYAVTGGGASPFDATQVFAVFVSAARAVKWGHARIVDNTIWNGVPATTGQIGSVAYVHNADTDTANRHHAEVSGNRVVGGAVRALVDAQGFGTTVKGYLSVERNACELLAFALVAKNAAATYLDLVANRNISAGTDAWSSTFTVDAGTDVVTVSSNAVLVTGMPVRVSNSGGALPTSTGSVLADGRTLYWIRTAATTGKLATTRANALAGTAVDITGAGTGTHTIVPAIWYVRRYDDAGPTYGDEPKFSGVNNVGFVEGFGDGDTYFTVTERLRVTGLRAVGGGLKAFYRIASLANGSGTTLPQFGNNGSRGIYQFSCPAAHDICAHFACSGTAITDFGSGGNVAYGAGSDPGGAGLLRIWVSGGIVNIYNDRGAATEIFVEYSGPGA